MTIQILIGDVRERLRDIPADSVNCIVTSPPYYALRDYGVDGQIGLEPSPDAYVQTLVEVFSEARRVLRDDGTLWLNLGDSYARGFGGGSPGKKASTNVGAYKDRSMGKVPEGLTGKDLIGIPWRVAFALQSDGWVLRRDIVWNKPNAMPESVQDRPTTAHEYVFLFSKTGRYHFDAQAIREGDRASRSVWVINTKPFKGAHFATMPLELAERCVLAGSPEGGTVLDPFGGSGTTGLAAHRHGRKAVLVELNPAYVEIAQKRIADATEEQQQPSLFT